MYKVKVIEENVPFEKINDDIEFWKDLKEVSRKQTYSGCLRRRIYRL